MHFGISIIGYRRPDHLKAVLESLDIQGFHNKDTHVWIDGIAHAGEFKHLVEECRALKNSYQDLSWHIHHGRLGVEKLMLDVLDYMSVAYDSFLILEDDCFPLKGSINEFRYELSNMSDNVYSVYGSLFDVSGEIRGRNFSRFQGWGWATTSKKCRSILPSLKRCFAMSESEYLKLVSKRLRDNPSISKKLDVTPGRDVLKVLGKQFSWDSCTAFLTADIGYCHKVPNKKLILNCGLSPNSGHFKDDNIFFRKPPFNMVTVDEVWSFF